MACWDTPVEGSGLSFHFCHCYWKVQHIAQHPYSVTAPVPWEKTKRPSKERPQHLSQLHVASRCSERVWSPATVRSGRFLPADLVHFAADLCLFQTSWEFCASWAETQFVIATSHFETFPVSLLNRWQIINTHADFHLVTIAEVSGVLKSTNMWLYYILFTRVEVLSTCCKCTAAVCSNGCSDPVLLYWQDSLFTLINMWLISVSVLFYIHSGTTCSFLLFVLFWFIFMFMISCKSYFNTSFLLSF